MESEWEDFTVQLNTAIAEARNSGLKNEEIAAALIMSAKREYAEFDTERYDTFTEFTQEVEFETAEFLEKMDELEEWENE